jgi:glycosyltransferase involved in cell wall biosynthesis
MRILLVAHGYPPVDTGGVERATSFLARGLVELGHRVSVFCREGATGRAELDYRRTHEEGITVHRVVNNFRLHASLRDYYENGHFDDRFAAVVAEEKPEVIHFQHVVGLSASLLERAARSPARVLLTLHDYFFLCHRVQLLTGAMDICDGPDGGRKCAPCVGGPIRELAARPRLRAAARRLRAVLPGRLERWLHRRWRPAATPDDDFVVRYRRMEELLRLPDLVLFPSAFVKETFTRHYPFLALGVVEPLGIALAPPPERRYPPPGPLRVLFLGSLLPFKGAHVLVEAMRRLPPGRATLAIHGFPGSGAEAYVAELERRARGLPITFGGSYAQRELGDLLQAAHVLVVPSLCYETFSLVTREARRYGRPVIASRLGALPEAVRDGVDGFLVPPGDPAALAAALATFIDDPALAERMGREGPPPLDATAHARAMSRHYDRLRSAAA